MRRLFAHCSALSLLLCVTACILWVRSYGLSDQLYWQRLDAGIWGRTAPGRLVLGRWHAGVSAPPVSKDRGKLKYTREGIGWSGNYLIFLDSDAGDINFSRERAGFAWYGMRQPSGTVYDQWVAPFWFIAVAAMVLPLGWMTRRWRSRVRGRRRIQGLCPSCGYDLRASPARCPECGAAVAG